jgi:hypothetical protein
MPTPFPILTPAADVDDVVARIDAIVAWSIDNQSRLGYFAALYKRITRAIGQAIASGRFQDGPRMERFDATFANRYFAALNGYFAPAQFPAPSHCWRVAFDAAQLPGPIIVQHMLLGVNAHIDLDLGITTWDIAPPGPLAALQADFDTVNAVLAEQVKAVLDEIDAISPVLADLYGIFQKDEIDVIDDGLVVFRDDAWNFATLLSLTPGLLDPLTITARDLEVAAFGSVILSPPRVLAGFVTGIAAQESRDVVHNIRVLDGIASEAL